MSSSPAGSSVRFSLSPSPSPSSPQQPLLTTGHKLARGDAVSALCSQAGFSKSEAEAVIRQAKENRAAERSEIRQARLELRAMVTANADLLKQVGLLRAENAALVEDVARLKRQIKELQQQDDQKPSKQQRRKRIPLLE